MATLAPAQHIDAGGNVDSGAKSVKAVPSKLLKRAFANPKVLDAQSQIQIGEEVQEMLKTWIPVRSYLSLPLATSPVVFFAVDGENNSFADPISPKMPNPI